MKKLAFAACAAALSIATVPAGAPPHAADFDWIGGSWCGKSGADLTEEHWLPARGGMLIGVGRTTQGERVAHFEFMRIVARDSQASYVAQPDGGSAVEFKWTAGGRDWARFENPTHDFPKRVEYRRTGDHLHAHIAGPGDGGKETVIAFEYDRCR
jgi:hypothetical protein